MHSCIPALNCNSISAWNAKLKCRIGKWIYCIFPFCNVQLLDALCNCHAKKARGYAVGWTIVLSTEVCLWSEWANQDVYCLKNKSVHSDWCTFVQRVLWLDCVLLTLSNFQVKLSIILQQLLNSSIIVNYMHLWLNQKLIWATEGKKELNSS